MTAAVLAAIAVWLLVPVSSRRRSRLVLVTADPPRSIDLRVVAAVVAPVGSLVLLGMPTGLLLGVVLAPVAHRAVGRLESAGARRRAAAVEAALPAALDLMVAALEVGRPPVAAFALVADATAPPLGPELGAISGRLAIAADPDTVWRSVAADPALAAVGRAFRRAESSGMPVAGIVAGVATELRRERAARLREQSRKVAVRTAAPLGACFLPAFFLVGIVPTVLASFRSLGW
ncbi:type II secretion system F family protein [Aeromicrobium stalagmiti]|uniref:type II secretion system F family protein n=1 Tax=Aeromicrobium stalagmiti TaxID=2738988 RepID=UPI0015683477|nr:type II secretion system F family protein [Aeromicrobium stalagmiti]